MIKHPHRHGAALVTVLAAGLLAVAGPATALEPSGDLATVTVSSAGVDFRPEVEYDRAILTVSGGGEVSRYEFARGEDPFLSVFGPAGQPLADGIYGWELDLLPARGARADLMIATTNNGGETPGARDAQTGVFAVVDGYIADSELREAGAGRPPADLAGLGKTGSKPLVLGNRASSDLSSETDADAGMCDAAASLRSASCETDVRDLLASLEDPAIDPFTSDLGARSGYGDSDSEVASGRGAEFMFEPSVEAGEAAPPRRTFDPEGANGRRRSEEDQR